MRKHIARCEINSINLTFDKFITFREIVVNFRIDKIVINFRFDEIVINFRINDKKITRNT